MPNSADENKNRELLLQYLRQNRNFVPTGGLLERFELACRRRQDELGFKSFSNLLDLIEVSTDELKILIEMTLPKQNAFFDEEGAWEQLRTEFIPRLLLRKRETPLRFWVIECGLGYSAYSLAILLCEALGQAAYQEFVKIFATDADDTRLQHARNATFSESDLLGIPDGLKHRYFIPAGKDFVFQSELRRSIIFGKHSVAADPCLSRMDLILCKQVLCYLNLEDQKIVFAKLFFALREEGGLVLADGEQCPDDSGFKESTGEPRVFRRSQPSLQAVDETPDLSAEQENDPLMSSTETVFDCSPVAHFAIDKEGLLATANARARASFGLTSQDFGKPFQDLEISYRPMELRSLIEQCSKKNKQIVSNRVPRTIAGRTQYFDVYVQPLIDQNNERIGVSVQFDEVSDFYEIQDQLSSVNQQLQNANEELQSAHEELETINEELQSTNEELETTNEELQSTNEELETMNEELQSTNSELENANDDQQKLATQVELTNNFLESILSSMRSCVIVLNEKYQVLVWNDYCRELWGLRADEVKGRSLFDLDIGLPIQALKTPLRTFVNLKKNYEEISLEAVNRRGRTVNCIVRITQLLKLKEPGVILLIEDQ